MKRAVIVGSGHVGSQVALLFALRELFDEVLLVDKRPARAHAEADDMMTALPRLGSRSSVRGGKYEDCAEADLVVLCAAAPARLGQTRNDMFLKNSQIVSEAVERAEAAGFLGLYVVVSNPVDLLTHHTVTALGVPSSRVVGTGTLLDTMRLEDCLRGRFGKDAQVSALALGEHGEGLVVDWGRTSVAGDPVPGEAREDVRRETIEAAYEIVKGKGSTSYGIAQAVVAVVEAWVRRDGADVLPLSAPLTGQYGIEGICAAVPVAFGSDGSPHVVELPLGQDVLEALRATTCSMREAYLS